VNILSELKLISNNKESLDNFIESEFENIYDEFSNNRYSYIQSKKNDIEEYIKINRKVILQIDISKKNNFYFLILLLDVSERLMLKSCFTYIYEHIRKNNLTEDLSFRTKAAALFLIKVKSVDDYIDRYEDIYSNLSKSHSEEYDNSQKTISCFVNFYSTVVFEFYDFNQKSIGLIRDKIYLNLEDKKSFLNDSIVMKILSIENINSSQEYLECIHKLLDDFLRRPLVEIDYEINNFIIEDGTEYSELLKLCTKSFSSIKGISTTKCIEIGDDEYFYSLHRGVCILENENQLFYYMRAYGAMHYNKLISAFQYIEHDVGQVDLIDWGCGQGIASMSFLEKKVDSQGAIKKVHLIEPSSVALSRASLHIRKYNSLIPIKTINKDLDMVTIDDFEVYSESTKIHFLSNIIDIETFSLGGLQKLIDNSFSGKNIFICVSPYINIEKNMRIDSFVEYFRLKDNFVELGSINRKKGEWINGWSKVVRVFECYL